MFVPVSKGFMCKCNMEHRRIKKGKMRKQTGDWCESISRPAWGWSASGGRHHGKRMLMTKQQQDDDESWKLITRWKKGRPDKSHSEI